VIAHPFDSDEEAVSSLFLKENESAIPVTLRVDQYTAKLANTGKIDAKLERLAIDIARKSKNHLLGEDKSRTALAAACIYLAATLLGVNLIRIDLPKMAGVTGVTIRSRCNDILTGFKLTIRVKPM
jgi:transcription initiation factor TFIIB